MASKSPALSLATFHSVIPLDAVLVPQVLNFLSLTAPDILEFQTVFLGRNPIPKMLVQGSFPKTVTLCDSWDPRIPKYHGFRGTTL
jgi:hypothetical protein